MLASADIPGLSSQPLTPLPAAPTARGCFVSPPHGNAPFWVEGLAPAGGGGISIFRISQLFPFPRSFDHPERLSLGCSLPSLGGGYFNQDHCSPLASPAFAACLGAVPILLPSPRLPPAAHTGSSVVETLFWSSRVHHCKHCKSYSRKAGGFPGVFPSASFPAVSMLGTEPQSAVFT